jgi:NAD-dependent DNA ligase
MSNKEKENEMLGGDRPSIDLFREAYNLGQDIIPDHVYDSNFGTTETDLDDNRGSSELVSHIMPMLSLHTHFIQTTDNLDAYKNAQGSFKLDGASASFEFDHGVLMKALSRGKKHSGYRLPKALHDKVLGYSLAVFELGEYVTLRGELVMTNRTFETRWRDKYKSPRAAVSACIALDKPPIELVDDIDFIIHRVYIKSGLGGGHKVVQASTLNQTIFKIAPMFICNEHYTIHDALNDANNSIYPCDGIVIQTKEQGDNGRVYLDTIAIKYQADEKYSADTKIERITWNQNTDGSLTPVVWYTPVIIDGSTCVKASGHCLNFLTRTGMGVGSKIKVSKQGGVIPYLAHCYTKSDNLDIANLNVIPFGPDDMQLYSADSEEAVARIKFIRGMIALDLKDCGPSQFNQLFDAGFRTIFDLAPFKQANGYQEFISNNNGFKDSITNRNLFKRIHDRVTTFDTVWCILGLNIPNIGFKIAMRLGQILAVTS